MNQQQRSALPSGLPLFQSAEETRLEAFLTFDGKGSQQQRICRALSLHGPLNDREIAERTGIGRHLIPARRGELEKRGFVVQHDSQRDAVTGMNAVRWKLITNG